MTPLKIAASTTVAIHLQTGREVVTLEKTDFTDVAAVVVSVADSRSGMLALLRHTGFNLPVFISLDYPEQEQEIDLPENVGLLTGAGDDAIKLEAAASEYQSELLPPFFNTLTKYVAMDNSTFACPGHQGGAFFKKHPAGRQFFDFFGENVFRADMCNADVKLGDLLIHEGSRETCTEVCRESIQRR